MSTEPKVLLVDDEPASLQALESTLTGQGYHLLLAESGAEALQKAHDILPDLILLDIMMPVMDGFEVCQRLREDKILAEMPIIMITALDDKESRLHGLEVGADDFVSKPFNRAELRARVRTITRLNRYRRIVNERRRFEWIAEHSRAGYVIVDVAGTITYANPQATHYLCDGASITDAVGYDFADLALSQYQCEPEEICRDWPAFLSDEHRVSYLVRPETFQTPALWLAVYALNQMRDVDNSVLFGLRDVTSEVTTWRDMRTFHTVIGHKLLTPLNILVGSLEVLSFDMKTEYPDMQEMVDFAYEGGTRLQSTIEEILFFLKGTDVLQIGAHIRLDELPTLILRAAENLSMNDIDITVEPTLHEYSTAVSSQSLEWIFTELLENAKKFHPSNKPSVEVTATLDRPGWARINIKDDGLHLTTEQIEQAWLPYYQGEKSFTGELPGMGLGLATVSATLWHVGGNCILRNRDDRTGVDVELILPLME